MTALATPASSPAVETSTARGWLCGRPGLVLMWLAVAGCAAGVVAGVVGGPLWLDEALSVEIARLPVPDLLDALRRDGSPPLYYLLLHGWMTLFGTGTVAVRLLTVLLVPVALVLAHRLGGRLAGRGGARGSVIVLATLPWTMRFGSETRMYLLVVVLVLAGTLALLAVRAGRSRSAVAALAGCVGGLLLTHYWALYLLFVVGLLHLPGLLRRSPAAVRVVVALGLGAAAFLPWLPSLLFQAAHTGAPWADPPGWLELLRTPRYWGGGSTAARTVLAALLVALAASALVRRPPSVAPPPQHPSGALPTVPGAPRTAAATPAPRPQHPSGPPQHPSGALPTGPEATRTDATTPSARAPHLSGALPTVPGATRTDAATPSARVLLAVVVATLALAWTSTAVAGGAYTGRYTAVVVPLVAVAVAVGAMALPGRRLPLLALTTVAVVGVATGVPAAAVPRTSAAGVADAFVEAARPGDVLVYCPDQLGPPVAREIGGGYQQVVYPTLGPPQLVDWVDYAQRNTAADPTAVATRLEALAGRRQLFVLKASGYRTFGDDCDLLLDALTALRGRPEHLFGDLGTTGQQLFRFAAP